MDKIIIGNKIIRYVKYYSEVLAFVASERSGNWVILGDATEDGKPEFWVVRPADASRLMKAGYELA
jgi:hypothetical protein